MPSGAFGPDAVEALPELMNALLRDDAAIVRQNAAWAIGQLGARPVRKQSNLLFASCCATRISLVLPRCAGSSGSATSACRRPVRPGGRCSISFAPRPPSRDDADDVLLRTALGKLTDLMENQNKQILVELMQLMSGNNSEEVLQ